MIFNTPLKLIIIYFRVGQIRTNSIPKPNLGAKPIRRQPVFLFYYN